MKRYYPPSGLTRGLDVLINAEWTPAQALAVFELLDDLRDRLWAHYELQLVKQLRKERRTSKRPDPGGLPKCPDDKPPF